MTPKTTNPELWCPRRAEIGGSRVYGPDRWENRRGIKVRQCSYCGSIHPDDFMTYAREGTAKLGPTDKNYKVYVTDPEITYVPESATYVDGKRTNVKKHPRQPQQLKFYFQHLSPEQCAEFVDLYNRRQRRAYDDDPFAFDVKPSPDWALPTSAIDIGYPGVFYRSPFFMAVG